MKKIIFIVLIAFFTQNGIAQTSVPDTTVYLKTFENNKSKYIGKPFSVLMNDLKISIQYFSPIAGLHHDMSKETATYFYFIVPEGYLEDFSSKYIRISWQSYLDTRVSRSVFKNAPDDSSNWVPAAINFYKNAIIKDIRAE